MKPIRERSDKFVMTIYRAGGHAYVYLFDDTLAGHLGATAAAACDAVNPALNLEPNDAAQIIRSLQTAYYHNHIAKGEPK